MWALFIYVTDSEQAKGKPRGWGDLSRKLAQISHFFGKEMCITEDSADPFSFACKWLKVVRLEESYPAFLSFGRHKPQQDGRSLLPLYASVLAEAGARAWVNHPRTKSHLLSISGPPAGVSG